TGASVLTPDGKPKGFVLTLHDVTEHRRAADKMDEERSRWQKELVAYQGSQEQLRFLRSIMTSLGEGVCALDRDGTIRFANPAAARLLGWQESELVGKSIDAVVQGTGNGTTSHVLDRTALQAIAPQQIIRKDNVLFRKQDGGALPVACTIAALGDQSSVEGA